MKWIIVLGMLLAWTLGVYAVATWREVQLERLKHKAEWTHKLP